MGRVYGLGRMYDVLDVLLDLGFGLRCGAFAEVQEEFLALLWSGVEVVFEVIVVGDQVRLGLFDRQRIDGNLPPGDLVLVLLAVLLKFSPDPSRAQVINLKIKPIST